MMYPQRCLLRHRHRHRRRHMQSSPRRAVSPQPLLPTRHPSSNWAIHQRAGLTWSIRMATARRATRNSPITRSRALNSHMDTALYQFHTKAWVDGQASKIHGIMEVMASMILGLSSKALAPTVRAAQQAAFVLMVVPIPILSYHSLVSKVEQASLSADCIATTTATWKWQMAPSARLYVASLPRA